MKKTFNPSFVACILVLVLMISITSCVAGSSTITTTPTTPVISTTPTTPTPPPEEPHVCFFGEWKIVKEATSTENGLRERRCECGKVEQEIIEASNTEFVITYVGTKSVYPEQNGYDSREGLELPNLPDEEAYIFIGWYTKYYGGDPVGYIPKGTSGEITLYAHWEPKKFTITYDYGIKNSSGYIPKNDNKTTYTIEDEFSLVDPEWSGLIFTHWTDEDDKEITKIKKGTTGNLTITAHWTTYENIAHPSTKTNVDYFFDKNTGFYYFMYELGSIENVILETTVEEKAHYTKTANIPHDIETTETFTITESLAQSKTNSFAKSHTNSKNWSETNERAISVGVGLDYEYSVGIEGGLENIITAEAKSSLGISLDVNSQWKHSSTNGGSVEDAKTVSHSMSYTKEHGTASSTGISIRDTISADLPNGHYYRYHVGIVRVFNIVIFDPQTQSYSLSTLSVLDKVSTATMYYPDSSDKYMYKEMPAIDFEYTDEVFDKIEEIFKSSYYVVYEGGEGVEGNMSTSIHTSGVDSNLSANTYSRAGYDFVGWNTKPDGTGTSYSNNNIVNNLSPNGKTVILYAMWLPNKWTLPLNAQSCARDNGYDISKPSNDSNELKHQKYIIGEYIISGFVDRGGKYTISNSDTKFSIQLKSNYDMSKDIDTSISVSNDFESYVKGTDINTRIEQGAFWIEITFQNGREPIKWGNTNVLKGAKQGEIITLISLNDLYQKGVSDDDLTQIANINIVFVYEIKYGQFLADVYSNWRSEYVFEFESQ